MAILPVLIKGPDFPDDVKVYKEAESQLQSAATNKVLKPYEELIRRLALRQGLLSIAREIVLSVPWIGHASSAALYRDSDPLNEEKMRSLTFAGNTDAMAFLQPIVVFSPDLRQVYVIATVTVYAWGPVRAFYMGSANLHADVSLNETKPELKPNGVEGLAASDIVGKTASEVRARVWFADDAGRLKQAIASDMRQLQKQIVNYLAGD